MGVRRTHHGDLDAYGVQPGDALCPASFDRGSPFEFEAEVGENRDSGIQGFHHDADVVHPQNRHGDAGSPIFVAQPGVAIHTQDGDSVQ